MLPYTPLHHLLFEESFSYNSLVITSRRRAARTQFRSLRPSSRSNE
jgi:hydrogenase maturation factor HypF (carbamoyltransferase family)